MFYLVVSFPFLFRQWRSRWLLPRGFLLNYYFSFFIIILLKQPYLLDALFCFMTKISQYPVDILMFERCLSENTFDIVIILLTYCKWNTWKCQFSTSTWHQDPEVGQSGFNIVIVRGRYPAETNLPGSYTTSSESLLQTL